MTDIQEFTETQALERLAEESGLAIAIAGEGGRQIAAINNNSICAELNPEGKFSPACSKFCGIAMEKAKEAGKAVGFVCHAGLDCRAFVPAEGKKEVVIVGRTFLRAENYRKATERAITGDWKKFPPGELFENVLLTGSADLLNKATQTVMEIVRQLATETPVVKQLDSAKPVPAIPSPVVSPVEETSGLAAARERASEAATQAPEAEKITPPSAEASAWRSFFGSILKTDYSRASASILEFLAHQFGLTALAWLEKRNGKLVSTTSFGEMKGRKVRLGISADDPRLINAFNNERPLEMGERPDVGPTPSGRMMNLFPIGIDGDISAAIAVLDPLGSATTKKHIARICHSIAPQFEILRLRNEVSGRDALTKAVAAFSDSLKSIDADDFWQNVTQNAAQMLTAERASLLIADEKSGELEVKAIIGADPTFSRETDVGGRVARIVFARNQPALVGDIKATSLPPAPDDRKYRTGSFLSYPIRIGQRTIGVMNFTDRASGKPFNKRSLELFQAIAPQLAVAIDRAGLKEKAGEFEQLSVTDALTGLLNRRYMEERLLEEIKRSNRDGFSMSFMMIDVDHFKSYNDQYGHPAGDEALKKVAHVIRETLRGADVAARFGGEEFAILLPQTTGAEAVTIAERIRANMEHGNFPLRKVTTSIGIASCSAELCASDTLIDAADKALYEAKRQGRNRVLAFEEINGTRAA